MSEESDSDIFCSAGSRYYCGGGNWNLGYFSDENDDDFEVGNVRINSGPEDECGIALLLQEVMGKRREKTSNWWR